MEVYFNHLTVFGMVIMRLGKGSVEMDYINYIHKLILSFRNNESNHFMFIKHYDTLYISEQEIQQILLKDGEDLCLLFHEFPMHSMQEPYGPFLGWIRDIYLEYFQHETPEDFVRNAGVYPLQIPVFASYITTGKATRREDVLFPELSYERKRMLDSLVALYRYVGSKKSLFIFMERLHLANNSCLDFLEALVKQISLGGIQILATYNEVYRMPEYVSKTWRSFVSLLEKRNYQYEWSSISTESTIDVQDVFIPKQSAMDGYILTANNMFYFLTLEDARHCLGIIYEKIQREIITVEEEKYVVFLQLFSLVSIMCKEYTKALQMCDYIGNIARKNKDDRLLYNYNYICAMSQYGVAQVENKVRFYVGECQKIANKYNNEEAEYKAEVLGMLADYNYWRETFVMQHAYLLRDGFYEQTERLGFQNILAHISVRCFDNDSETVQAIIRGEKKPEMFIKGVRLAKEIENWDFLIAAYTKMIVLFSENGCYQFVEACYQKKLEIFEQEENIARKVHSYNGLGHNATVAERYQQAEEYFNNSLKMSLKIKDGQEVAITLYNSAFNKILAREFSMAAEDLKLILQIMELLDMHSLSICDTSRIYGLLGFCSFYRGEEYQCYLCLNRMEAYIRHLYNVTDENKYRYWHDTLFFKHMIRAMLCMEENQIEEAEKEFDEAYYHQSCTVGNQYFNYPLYIIEKAKFYAIQEKDKEREEILEEGINFCNEHGYHVKANMLLRELKNKREIVNQSSLPNREISNEKILDVIENLAVQRNLELNKKDIDFMNVWQQLLNRNISSNEMLSQAINMAKNYFSLDGMGMFEIRNDEVTLSYFDGPQVKGTDTNVTRRIMEFTELEREKIASYFRKNRQSLLTNRIDKGFLEYKKLLEVFDIDHVITFFATPLVNSEGELDSIIFGYVEMRNNYIGNRYLLMDHDFVILKFFSNQLFVALERLKHLELINRMNHQLSAMAVTDLLTGLYNRQGFEKLINEDRARNNEEENVMIYIDLDNFKYYNDTFGHEIGDFVLVRFAQMLERVIDDCGYAVRYGGDEFVLVINGRDVEFGKKIAQNLFFMLTDGLNGAIERKIGHAVIIPPEKQLSCSMGIATFKGYDAQKVTEALNKADKGLYYVKKTTKNSFVVWDELKEE